MNIHPKAFPIILIVEMLAASLVYAIKGDLRHSMYWLAGAVLNICVTF